MATTAKAQKFTLHYWTKGQRDRAKSTTIKGTSKKDAKTLARLDSRFAGKVLAVVGFGEQLDKPTPVQRSRPSFPC